MRNGDAEADAGAHRFFALFKRGENALAAGRIDFARLTSRSINSTIAGQRSVAFISGMICSEVRRLARDMRSFPSGAKA